MDQSNEEEEEDLYSDLPNFKYDETIDKLKASSKEYQTRVAHLEEVLEKQKKELEECRSQCATLTNNISSLLKTAQTEIKRKDNKINELNKTIIELKTDVLALRKRKYSFGFCDEIKPSYNKEELMKRPKLQVTSSEIPALGYSRKPALTGNTSKNEELPESDNPKTPVILKKQIAPDIKCHTLYSQRMYNKIYNINNKTIAESHNTAEEALQIKTNNAIIEKENLIVNTMKSDDNNLPLLTDYKQHKASLNLHDKNISGRTISLEENNESNVNMLGCKFLFSVVDKKNTQVTSNNKILHQDKPTYNNWDHKQMVLNYRTDSTEIKRDEVDSVSKIISLAENNSLNNSDCDQILKSTNCIKEKKQVIICKTNRSVNFSKSESISKSVHVKHYRKGSAISSASMNEKILSNAGDLGSSYNISSECDKNQVQSNEKVNSIEISSPKESSNKQFTNGNCIKKDKKHVKDTICPISGHWVKMNKMTTANKTNEVDVGMDALSDNKPENDNLDIMEELFGSPLKWTENSVDDLKQDVKLSPPATAFEDSCSAHIENVKFKKTENNVTDNTKTKITEMSLTKKFSYTERKCYFQSSGLEADNVLPSFCNRENTNISKDMSKKTSITHWPFSKTNNEIPSKTRVVASPTFSSFVTIESTSEACDVPSSLRSDPNTVDSVNGPLKFIKSPKYNDSILGQFDDTTQLINALAKDPSKLSPIHTPIKESNMDAVTTKTPPLQIEKSGHTSLAPSVKMSISVSPPITFADKKVSVVTGPVLSVEKKNLIPSSQVSTPTKIPMNPNTPFEKKVTPITSPVKKISIPASVISSVEKKLSFPTTVLSPEIRKVEKKTILLDKPINILCPRKTPRQIGRCKQNVSKKQNQGTSIENKTNQIIQDECNEIKSPSPFNEKGSITEPCSTNENLTVNAIKNYKVDENVKKRHSVDKTIKTPVNSSSKGKSRSSKSPSNVFHKSNREPSRISNNVTGNRNNISTSRSPLRKEFSPIKENRRHYFSRKENISRRREHRSPSRKENSPSSMRREKWQGCRAVKPVVFKRPEPRRESFRKPNCYFRQSSVERKISKDLRHSFKTRNTPVRIIKPEERATGSNNKVDSKCRQATMTPTKATIISRSSRISWSASTGVVSTKTNEEQNSDFSRTPPQIKWVLRPIDFDTCHYNTSKECFSKAVPEESSKALLISKNEIETPSKPSPARESRFVSPDKNSPAKPIVIVAKRRPVKFGCNN